MSINTRYTATLNERWDAISQANYGTPFEYERIRRANPTVTDQLFMTEGRALLVPVIAVDESVSTAAAENLPPWRR